jgi:hypothetical protein
LTFYALIAADCFDNTQLPSSRDIAEVEREWWLAGPKTLATIRHLAPISRWETEKPFCLNLPLPEGQPRTNFVGADYRTEICDGRSHIDSFDLDIHGFAFTSLPRLPDDFDFEDLLGIEKRYVADMEDFLVKRFNASAVYVFDYTVGAEVRSKVEILLTRSKKRRSGDLDRTAMNIRPPGMVAHVGMCH